MRFPTFSCLVVSSLELPSQHRRCLLLPRISCFQRWHWAVKIISFHPESDLLGSLRAAISDRDNRIFWQNNTEVIGQAWLRHVAWTQEDNGEIIVSVISYLSVVTVTKKSRRRGKGQFWSLPNHPLHGRKTSEFSTPCLLLRRIFLSMPCSTAYFCRCFTVHFPNGGSELGSLKR